MNEDLSCNHRFLAVLLLCAVEFDEGYSSWTISAILEGVLLSSNMSCCDSAFELCHTC
jgi:hypothetical protein